MAKLTKGLLQGSNLEKEITVNLNGEEYDIEIRPLTGPEATKVEEELQEGNEIKGTPGKNGKMEQRMTIDPKKNTKGRKRSDLLAVAYGTTDDDFTKEVVENHFPNNLIVEVAREVKSISGIGNDKEVEQFRPNGDGNDGGSESLVHSDAPDRDTAERNSSDESFAEDGVRPSV